MQIGNINLIKHKQVSRLKTAWTQTHGTNDYRREWEQLNSLLAHGDSRLVLVVAPVGANPESNDRVVPTGEYEPMYDFDTCPLCLKVRANVIE